MVSGSGGRLLLLQLLLIELLLRLLQLLLLLHLRRYLCSCFFVKT